MGVHIEFGGTCRDVDKLPSSEAELRAFFMEVVAPDLFADFSRNVATARTAYRNVRPVNIGITDRGCEVGGKIVITL